MAKHDPSPMNQEPPPSDATKSGSPPTAPDKSLLETYLEIEEALLSSPEIPPIDDVGGE